MAHWLRLCTPNLSIRGSIPGRGTISHMLQLRPGTAKLKRKKNQKDPQPGVSTMCALLLKARWGFPGGPVVKNLPCNARDTGSIPGP